MKKRGALLVFLLAGAMAVGVGVGAGCKKGDNSGNGDIGDITTPDGHRHNYRYEDNGNGTHRAECTMEGCEVVIDNMPHVDTAGGGPNGKCDYCGAVLGTVEEDKVTSVKISGATQAKLGESVTLIATVEGTGNIDKSVVWEIYEGPATINDGVVTAVVAGTVKVRAVSKEDDTIYGEHTIVFEKDNSSVEETVTVAISGSDSVTVNESVTLTATVLPDTLTDRTVTWSVIGGTGTATITAEGVLTGTKEGTVTVVAISNHNNTASATKMVSVKAAGSANPDPDNPDPDNPNPDNPDPDNPDPDNPDIPDNPDPEEPTVLTEDTALKMTAGETKTLSAAAGTEWTTSDATVATVNSDGVISAKTAGVTKIRANVDGVITICTVIVQPRKSSGGDTVTKDPFSFKKTVDIGSVETGGDIVVEEEADEYTVKFSDGIPSQHVASGGLAVKPVGVEKAGYYRQGWYTSADYTTEYDFSKPVTGSLNLVAKWQALPAGVEYIEGNQESISLIWTESKPAEAKVEYSAHGENNWKRIDQELIRKDGLNARADVLGISKGVYDVKITTSAGDEKLLTDIRVDSYDRSGYAHFNYTNGVGAYNDDGTLKDNALVIYVTNENKDTVMEQVCAANSDVNMFQIPNYGGGKDWGGKNASGIGWWLNNNQYTSSNAGSAKNKRPSNTYDPTNGGKLGFKSVDRPIVIRFIGTVETPEGCTAYNTPDEGGGVGDNGHMARLKNLKNITLEGVGDNAQIKGWGFHFVKGTDAVDGQGTSFEVRNLTFNEYPEDAIGMEGQQAGGKITAGVERCWIHNNTFLPGRCDSPAESDKAEGDGSCDFKRGQYFTCSYNYFEYCHKTNLVGSSDDSLQYNMTYHHNTWYQCGSRIPLTRQANVHFYNNWVCGDASETSTPYSHISKPALSYVHSLRANCYLYSEYNYYDGCKNVTDGKNGGAAKGWQNNVVSCAGTNTINVATSRTSAVSSSCGYDGTSYANFDTNDQLFYYDKETGKSKVELLDDAVSARTRAVMYSGALGHGTASLGRLEMNKESADSAVVVGSSGTNITLGKAGTTNNGVKFLGTFNGTKGKGQLCTFTLTAPAELTITATASAADCYPQVLRSDGKVMAEKFNGTVTVLLGEGTYLVTSGQKDKEASISAMSFADTAASGEIRVNAAKSALAAIPQLITVNSKSLVENAQRSYSALSSAERGQIDAELYQRLVKAIAAYEEISVAHVIARIDYIGEVTENSASDIRAAQQAYAALAADLQSKVTNYSKLTAAQTAFEQFELSNVKAEFDALPELRYFDRITDSKPAIELALDMYQDARAMYESLDDEKKSQISVTSIDSAIVTLENALKPFTLKDLIAALPDSGAADYYKKVGEAKALYDALTADQKELLTAAEKTKLEAAIADYTEHASQAVVGVFAKSEESKLAEAGFTLSGKVGYKDGVSFNYEGMSYSNPLKMQSDTTISFTVSSKMTISIKLDVGGKRIKLNGATVTTGSDGVYTATIEAGSYSLTKGDSCNLCWITLSPAN